MRSRGSGLKRNSLPYSDLIAFNDGLTLVLLEREGYVDYNTPSLPLKMGRYYMSVASEVA
jgi:hypothetical protein